MSARLAHNAPVRTVLAGVTLAGSFRGSTATVHHQPIPLTEEQEAQVLSLYRGGASVHAIENQTSVGRPRLVRFLTSQGIDVEARGGPGKAPRSHPWRRAVLSLKATSAESASHAD